MPAAARTRLATVGRDHEAASRLEGLVERDTHADRLAAGSGLDAAGRAAWTVSRGAGPAAPHPAIGLDHIASASPRPPGRDPCRAEVARSKRGPHGWALPRPRRPRPDATQDPLRPERKRDHAVVVARLLRGGRLDRFTSRPAPACRRGHRRDWPDMPSRQSGRRSRGHGRCYRPPSVPRSPRPSSDVAAQDLAASFVTSTSSSIRMPMPHHFLGTPGRSVRRTGRLDVMTMPSRAPATPPRPCNRHVVDVHASQWPVRCM